VLIGGVKGVSGLINTECHVVYLHKMFKCPSERGVYIVFVAKFCERFGDCAKVTHPEEVVMTEACAVKRTIPGAIDDLGAHFLGSAWNMFKFAEVSSIYLACPSANQTE
jgi:hypothetical protein